MLTAEGSWCAVAERSGTVPTCRGMSCEHELAAETLARAQATCGMEGPDYMALNNDQGGFTGFALKYSFPLFSRVISFLTENP